MGLLNKEGWASAVYHMCKHHGFISTTNFFWDNILNCCYVIVSELCREMVINIVKML